MYIGDFWFTSIHLQSVLMLLQNIRSQRSRLVFTEHEAFLENCSAQHNKDVRKAFCEVTVSKVGATGGCSQINDSKSKLMIMGHRGI